MKNHVKSSKDVITVTKVNRNHETIQQIQFKCLTTQIYNY